MAYIAILKSGMIMNVNTYPEAKAIRHSIELLLTVENNKVHSVRHYNSAMDELAHCEESYLVEQVIHVPAKHSNDNQAHISVYTKNGMDDLPFK